MFSKSQEYFKAAGKHLVGGVNSPARSFKAVGMEPLFFEKGKGAHIEDVDGNDYIDYVGSFGPMILGHCHPEVDKEIHATVDKGTSFGANTRLETDLAKLVKEAFPSIDRLRFVNSGTEAVMSAIRLARGATGRNKIIKFSGCYHGHYDALLKSAGSGVMTHGLSSSAGVPDEWVRDTIVLPFNDSAAVENAFKEHKGSIAGVILEPVTGNMGVALPHDNYLEALRTQTREDGALLIFDEVMTGFRAHFGGVQSIYNITPDLTCLGKVIGGGMPVGAYGGRDDLMALIAPEGNVYQAGTLSGNPVAMAAGIATLKHLKANNPYPEMLRLTEALAKGFKEAAEEHGIPLQVNHFGTMISPFFTETPVTDHASVQKCDTERFGRVFRRLIEAGVFPPPSQFEAWFMSAAHTQNDIDNTVQRFREALKAELKEVN